MRLLQTVSNGSRAVSLFATAVLSFGIHGISSGELSYIHIFSAITVIAVPWLVFAGRTHRIARHRRTARAIVTGTLLAAGYFTLLPSRILGGWLGGWRNLPPESQRVDQPAFSVTACTGCGSWI